MKNHGSITTADTLDKALGRCVTLEWCSKVYLKALSGGAPNILSVDEMSLAQQQMDSFAAKRQTFESVKKQG
jgi:ribulose-5-phosphate 4-epimerase/fuculose-1-phosphate aldolase